MRPIQHQLSLRNNYSCSQYCPIGETRSKLPVQSAQQLFKLSPRMYPFQYALCISLAQNAARLLSASSHRPLRRVPGQPVAASPLVPHHAPRGPASLRTTTSPSSRSPPPPSPFDALPQLTPPAGLAPRPQRSLCNRIILIKTLESSKNPFLPTKKSSK